MDREELKQKIDELMHKYQEREIDSETYATEMMNLTASAQETEDNSTGCRHTAKTEKWIILHQLEHSTHRQPFIS
ncbi:hypothetical protein [Corynebacterium antarcticum]|uniref:hypothetical protein n=1 Tax=Corynebacterium antarcticum TaxID=2800405 RepID=UPI002002F362|nr:hypothetical protein [Corynebacterium antarcticum]MCK7643056.1 hypothetical protein [Corynebacterium antarcticum]MCK7661559.1 hypothetical protein [Corynebacterium antarcticum]MCX7493043.1 hypothetical protein [Corynebacterium antarcticum]MCX7540896.1 hypothetical protein [Corynebacterium antarcticum]